MEQRQFFVRDILTVIFKHKKLILLFPIVVLLIVGALSYIWPPTYESEAKVRIMRGREVFNADPTVNESSAGVALVQLGAEEINSEIELLHSKDLLREVVNTQFDDDGQMRTLYEHSEFPFGEGILQAPFKAARAGFVTLLYILQLVDRPTPEEQAMQQLDDRLITEYVRDSHVIDVAVRVGDPVLAQQVLQKVLDTYIENHIEMYANERTNPFFIEQKKRVEEELRRGQNELQEYQKTNNISLLDTEKALLLQQYTDSKRVLTQLAQTKLLIEESFDSEDLDSSLVSMLASQTEGTVVREMQLRLLELMLEYNRVIQSLGPRHPTVDSLLEQIRASQANLLEAIDNVEKTETSRLQVIQSRLDELNDTRAELQKMQQDVTLLESQYGYYSAKVEESLVADQLAAQSFSNVRIASHPTVPTNPVFPNKLANMLLALIGGTIAALALAFFLDYLDHGLKTPEDVEYYTRVQPLASFFNAGGQPLRAADAERLAILLDRVNENTDSQVLQVTSSVAGEGSANVANALADAFANDPEARTLLIDFSGEVARARGVRHGVSDVLLEQASFDEVFTSSDALTIVGRGSTGEYPTYLWSSERMQALVEQLRGRYRHILLHTSPILSSHDPVKLVRYCDGVLLVIKSDSTRREVVNRALAMFGESRPKVVGAVLTERRQEIPQSVYRRI